MGFSRPKYKWETTSKLRPTRVAVLWDDAKATKGKEKLTSSEIKKEQLAPQETLGFLVKDTDTQVGVASEMDLKEDRGSYRQVSFIPRKVISQIVPLGRRNVMVNALKESYMRGSKGKAKMGDMRLDRVTIQEADDGTFIIECSYKSEHKHGKNGETPYPMYDEKKKTAKNADELMELIEDLFGD